ncbi:type II toxin-antitoxin system RelE/ParE family toxin [Caulobacter sp. BK020]|uniref:type II toxin-antitoxin system RelE/ParE family toxin n=1 Tax=Caulobacter sp. BK020 TaxID=2512117 RepID=UPI001046A525|nr:type II toxin-antitoxin system RelE/ParE family toxin [Caulobacter sp. BK020]
MIRAILSVPAQRDVAAAALFIAKDSKAAARTFQLKMSALLTQLGNFPQTGTARPEIVGAPYRFAPLLGFPYVAIYNAARRPPIIMRVLHGSQDLPAILQNLPQNQA